jgi:polygalacturonase
MAIKSILIPLLLTVTTISANTKNYDITIYGAVPDGKTIATQAINKAVEACNADGGGVVYVPAGTFLTGTIILKDNVELYLERGSTLLGSTDYADYPLIQPTTYRSLKDIHGWAALIYADGAKNIAVRGAGTIDGQGAAQKGRPEYQEKEGDRDGRSRNILLVSCKHICIEGITMRNAAIWNQHYLNCEDLFINGLYVYNHCNRNNDGIDIDGCRRVTMSNCILDSDDDCITLKSTGPAPCEDIVITNCVASSCCNGIKMGTESSGGFCNITISNCVVKPTRCSGSVFRKLPRNNITGLSLEIVDGGIMQNINIDDIVMYQVQAPIYIRLGNRARKYADFAPSPGRGIMRNINISNIVAYGSNNLTSSITGVPGSIIENVRLNSIQLYNKGGIDSGNYFVKASDVPEMEKGYPQPDFWGKCLPASVLFIRHAKNIVITNLNASPEEVDPRTPIVADDVDGLIINNTEFNSKFTAKKIYEATNAKNVKVTK